ncbi:GPW/gp25 family protein [Zhongshania borealis]|uniref:GPW/gp25 family protein n=1 Tax=Zhongshania borealis TaxID=889488 RepID=A0ABP7WES3_9GAMM
MKGLNANTGKHLEGAAHLQQSLADIISTPLGSRVMRRDYGSLVPMLIDQPLNPATKLRLYAATAHAIAKWEPRLTMQRAIVSTSEAGKYQLEINGVDELGKFVSTGVKI